MEYSAQVKDFMYVVKWLAELRFVTSHGGNLAVKLQDDLFLTTPTRRYKNTLEPEDLVFIDCEGEPVEGRRQPTGETPMYLNLFRERPDINSAIHCHPPYTNAFAIMKKNWLMRPIFPETIVEIGPVPVVPYGEPLTQRLADNFKPYLQKYNTFIMENHGVTAISPSGIVRLMHIMDMLEVTSVSILSALAAGEIKEIPKEEVVRLENTMKSRELPMIGAPGVNKSYFDLYDFD